MSGSNSWRTNLRNPLVLSYYVPALIFAFCQGLLIPVLPLYVKDFGISYGLVGLALAGEALGGLLGDVPAGVLARRLGQKRSMVWGLACVLTSTAALFWTQSIPQVLLCRLLAGFGGALYGVARHAYITDMTALTTRGRAVALSGGTLRIGRFAGPALGGMLATAWGLRAPFLLYGGVCAIALLCVASFVAEPSPRQEIKPGPPGNHLLATLKAHYRMLVAAGSGQIFAQMIRAGRQVIVPLYGADVLGLGPNQIGLAVSLSSAVDMTLFYPAGWIMDRWGRKYAIVPSFLIQAIGMGLVPLTGSFAGLSLAASLIGLGNGIGSGTMMTLGGDLKPADSRGEFLGVWRLIGDVGASGGPLAVGAVADLLVLPAAAGAMAGAGLMAALIFAWLVPETLSRKQDVGRGRV